MTSRTQDTANDLRDRILCGRIAPGTHLQEIPLAQELGVSRTPVRAALATLASEGLLEYAPKRGYTVRGFSLAEVAAAHEVRANLEGMACRFAAERGLAPAEERELERILALGDAILAKGGLREEDREPWTEMNDLFHSRIIELAENRLLSDLIDRTCRVPLASSRVVHWYDFDALKGSHQLHHRIYRYIRERRAVNAEALMREHIFQGIDQIFRRVDAPVSAGNDAQD
ncbi:MAG: GntR family transcriptional regulator [Rhodospirillaceae bacterium]|nr:GntR family transcriptional regulator [Rhodospirillaceae bacterium]